MASKHYHFKFNFDHDKEIIDRIESKENKNDYIRGLVLSDIAADILRESIKLDNDLSDRACKYCEEEDCSNCYQTIRHQARIDFYNDNCPAISELDSSKNPCDGCKFNVHYTDVDGKEKEACSLEDAWEKHWAKESKSKLNSLYGKAVSGNG